MALGLSFKYHNKLNKVLQLVIELPELIGKLIMQDGLGDTIRVSLTEPPEEEIDPCRRLANLGMRAAELQKGVVGF